MSNLSEERPWGSWHVLDEGDGYKVKRINVHPGQRLSYQTHEHRSEHWVVIFGTATCVIDGETVVERPRASPSTSPRARPPDREPTTRSSSSSRSSTVTTPARTTSSASRTTTADTARGTCSAERLSLEHRSSSSEDRLRGSPRP